jgi:type II restriction/modification system DNA methylase subunit YeeA
MLFLIRCFDLYLKPGGKLGFLVPFTLFKTQAGAGFREFLIKKTKIHVVHDLVTLYPFEGAINRTAAIVVEKICELNIDKMPDNERERCIKIMPKIIEENIKGIRHVIWVNPTSKAIQTDASLDEVLRETKRYEAIMLPVDSKESSSPWMQITPSAIEAIRKLLTGKQYYEAHEGVNTALNQVYYIQIKGRTPDSKLIITNPPELGTKKKVKQVEAVIEPDLVHPLIRGRDIKKWYAELKNRYVIIPHDPTTGKPYKPEDMKVRFPNTYNYLVQYKEELKKRAIKPFLSLREKIKKAKSEAEKRKAEEELDKNFYIVDNIGIYTFAQYKVVWKRISGEISGKAVSFACAVVEPVDGKTVIPDDGTILIEAQTPDEAYYITGLLNSLIVRTVIASYTYELRQETHIADVIKIPKFDPSNGLHKRIADLSRRAHELAKCIYAERKPDYCRGIDAEQELKNVEREIDLAVAQLFGLSEDDVREFEKLMAILSGEELPSEEEEVEIPKEPKIAVLNTLLPPNTPSHIEIDVVNPSGEEITFSYEFPWGKGSFKLIEGKQKIQTPPLGPGKYGGVVRYVWHGVERVISVNVEVSETSGPKRPKRLLDLGEQF